jgi:hypothetical protein
MSKQCFHEELDRVYATDYDEGWTFIWKCCECDAEFNLTQVMFALEPDFRKTASRVS